MALRVRSNQCPDAPSTAYVTGEPISGSFTFQRIILIVAWVCFGITLLLWLGLVIPHLRRYNIPDEQRQIFRIILTPLIFAIFAVAAIHCYSAASYLAAIPNLYEAWALASLFLLYVHFVVPEAHTREEFFAQVEHRKQNGEIVPGRTLKLFRRLWRTVFFYLALYTILIIIGEILEATKAACSTSKKPRVGHIIIQVLELGGTIYVILAIIKFQRRFKEYMPDRKALPKLITFKLFVLVTTLQRFVFNILKSQVQGSSKVTYRDITVGIPALLTCIEAVLFTASYYLTFHAKEYRDHRVETRSISGMFGALLHALNPMDLIRGIGYALTFRHQPAKSSI
ncbi:hypothetical protein PV10_06196 [Exophiala mesophila]|uniref:DUF300-domain-containing protein n=1 Tax=Exophiala mesophila TaxID=212818 RepID=A0A0D1ZAG7_EXOME|nr:uncharacterized protein PV10_06196 [Exophiala mesophila]KIV91682.1 hypothetical protein PV10_06196 [Exophiala mesophila]